MTDVRIPFDGYTLTLLDEPTYGVGSTDNVRRYSLEHLLGGVRGFEASSRHGVKVFRGELAVSSCICVAPGGRTGIHAQSALVHRSRLVLAVGSFMACLLLPDLGLEWSTQTDEATCFGVYHARDHECFVSHGEAEIAGVSYGGSVLWRFSGADIFTNGFELSDHHVDVIDWNDTKYRIDLATGKGHTLAA